MNVLVDTNFLVRLRQSGTPTCQICEAALQRLLGRGDTLYLCAQVAIEFWSVATRPINANGLGLSPEQADAALRDAEQWIVWLPEPPDIGVRWRALVNRYRVEGRQAHDARLVAFMEASGLNHLLTLNVADFRRYPTITALDPSTVAPA